MSGNKVPVTFLGGHSSRNGVLGLFAFPDMLRAENRFCRLFSFMNGVWGCHQDDFQFNCCSLTYLLGDAGYKAWWLLGKNGEAVEIRAGVATIEQIPGAGLERAAPYGYVEAIKNIGGELYVCGYGRQVYKRSDGQWISIADDILTRETATGFFDIDGTNASSIYAVGWHGEIYHFDGHQWHSDDSPTTAHLAGLRCLPNGEVWICGNQGVVLRGRFNQWTIIQDDGFPGNWYGIEEFNGRIYLAGNDSLACVVDDSILPIDTGLGRAVSTHRLHAKEGLLWSIGEKDILVFDGSTWTEVQHPDNA